MKETETKETSQKMVFDSTEKSLWIIAVLLKAFFIIISFPTLIWVFVIFLRLKGIEDVPLPLEVWVSPVLYALFPLVLVILAFTKITKIEINDSGILLQGWLRKKKILWRSITSLKREQSKDIGELKILYLLGEKNKQLGKLTNFINDFPKLVYEIEKRAIDLQGKPVFDRQKKLEKKRLEKKENFFLGRKIGLYFLVAISLGLSIWLTFLHKEHPESNWWDIYRFLNHDEWGIAFAGIFFFIFFLVIVILSFSEFGKTKIFKIDKAELPWEPDDDLQTKKPKTPAQILLGHRIISITVFPIYLVPTFFLGQSIYQKYPEFDILRIFGFLLLIAINILLFYEFFSTFSEKGKAKFLKNYYKRMESKASKTPGMTNTVHAGNLLPFKTSFEEESYNRFRKTLKRIVIGNYIYAYLGILLFVVRGGIAAIFIYLFKEERAGKFVGVDFNAIKLFLISSIICFFSVLLLTKFSRRFFNMEKVGLKSIIISSWGLIIGGILAFGGALYGFHSYSGWGVWSSADPTTSLFCLIFGELVTCLFLIYPVSLIYWLSQKEFRVFFESIKAEG